MVCPKCGKELGEGNMYCEVCGEEIKFVPDFEPEIELSMSSVLNDVADEIDPSRVANTPDIEENIIIEEKHPQSDVVVVSKKGFIIVSGLFLAVIILAMSFLGYQIYKDNSESYQINAGDGAYSQGKYVLAQSFYERAYTLSGNTDCLFKIANCYEACGNIDATIDTYFNIIIENAANKEAYQNLVRLLSLDEDYDRLNEILLVYAPEDIQLEYSDYTAKIPEFSIDSGTYDDVIELELIPATEGSIYYTTDGSEPGSDCILYTEPIVLKRGQYIINAVFVNQFGACSDMVAKEYIINSKAPSEPVISLDDGDYDLPQMITVAVAETDANIYYTADGTDPSENSLIYSAPISIPLGSSEYRFAAINKEGVASDIVIRHYNLNVPVKLDENAALATCIQRQIELGRILDANGSVEGAIGVMMYKLMDLRYVNEHVVYFVLEYYQEGGVFTNVDTLFAIDAMDGTVYHAIETGNNSYRLEIF